MNYKRTKVRALTREWTNLLREIEQSYLSSADAAPALEDREKSILSESVSKVVAGQDLTCQEHAILAKTLGMLVDGSRLAFSDLAEAIKRRLSVLGLSFPDFPDHWGMDLADLLAQKDTMLAVSPSSSNPPSFAYFEMKWLERCGGSVEAVQLEERQLMRRKAVGALDSLASYISSLEQARDDVESLNGVNAAERRYTQARSRYDQMKLSRRS